MKMRIFIELHLVHRTRIPLWRFLVHLLDNDLSETYVQWTQKEKFEFKIKKPAAVASLWGTIKDNTGMTYDKFARAMRYYYGKKIIEKASRKRYSFQFVISKKTSRYLDKNNSYKQATKVAIKKKDNCQEESSFILNNIQTERSRNDPKATESLPFCIADSVSHQVIHRRNTEPHTLIDKNKVKDTTGAHYCPSAANASALYPLEAETLFCPSPASTDDPQQSTTNTDCYSSENISKQDTVPSHSSVAETDYYTSAADNSEASCKSPVDTDAHQSIDFGTFCPTFKRIDSYDSSSTETDTDSYIEDPFLGRNPFWEDDVFTDQSSDNEQLQADLYMEPNLSYQLFRSIRNALSAI